MTTTLSTVLEVGLGMVLVYYILSLIVSYVTSEIAKWAEIRAKDLKEGLRDLLEDSGKLDELLERPLIKNLKPKRLRFLRTGINTHDVDHIPASTFAAALFDVLAPGEEGKGSLNDIKTAIDALPDGDTKKALLGLINSSVDSLEGAHKKVEGWFDDAMQNVSSLYKQHARRIAVAVALVVTLVTGVDSIAVTKSLWQEPAIRASIAAKVDEYLKDEAPKENVQTYIATLEELKVPILWSRDTLPEDPAGVALKIIGLSLTWVAVSQGSSFWYQVLKRIRTTATAGTASSDAET